MLITVDSEPVVRPSMGIVELSVVPNSVLSEYSHFVLEENRVGEPALIDPKLNVVPEVALLTLAGEMRMTG